jgi:hypothetical protein
MDGEICADMSGHFTHGKAHVSIEFVTYLYMISSTEAIKRTAVVTQWGCARVSMNDAGIISNGQCSSYDRSKLHWYTAS